nr:MAG TPA: hypothetical protein [Caudoviricetes sp.]
MNIWKRKFSSWKRVISKSGKFIYLFSLISRLPRF